MKQKCFSDIFLALFSRKICFCNSEVIFGDNAVKIGESVYFCMRIKMIKVNYWPKIAFYPLKWHFEKKAVERPKFLIFWQKMSNSILRKV